MAVLFGVVQLSLSPSAWVGGSYRSIAHFQRGWSSLNLVSWDKASMSNEIDEIHQPIRIYARCLA